MQYRKFVAIFVIALLISSVIYPLSAIGSSQKEEHDAVESESEKGNSGESHDNEKPHEEKNNQISANTDIPQTGADEEDNRHPSGKDRSIEHGNSQNQGRSNSDPDGKENTYGGSSGKDKLGFDGGLDKGDQDGNNGCGNDDDFEDDNNGNCKGHNHPQKNLGGCDANGSTGDKNGRPCDPGKKQCIRERM